MFLQKSIYKTITQSGKFKKKSRYQKRKKGQTDHVQNSLACTRWIINIVWQCEMYATT